MIVVILGIAWLVGIWLASVLNWSITTWLILSGIGFLSGLILRRQPNYRLLLMAVAVGCLGAVRFTTAVPTIDANHIATYNNSGPITLTGLVVDEPAIFDKSINLRIDAQTINFQDGTSQEVTGTAMVRVARFPIIHYGTRLQLTGELENPPDDGEFDYRAYLARQGVHSLMSRPKLTILAQNEGNPLYHAIFAIKARAQKTIIALFPNPHAALLSGILLGNDNGIPDELADDFRATGMTHIIAISGFNIAILIAILVSLGEPIFSRRGAVLVAMIGIVLYTILVGADASVVRAAIMGSIFLIASRLLGRPNFAYASLFLAAFVMTLVNPQTLWDVGFQLSFTATLGLMLYADPITNWTRIRLQNWLNKDHLDQVMGVLSEAVLLTIAAQILTLPLMVATFGQLSLISLPANALILPAQPGVMTWGGLATLIGMIFPAMGQLLAWIAWLFLAYTIELVRVFAQIPGAVIDVEMSTAVLITCYVILGTITWLIKQPSENRLQVWKHLRQNASKRLALGGSLVLMLLIGTWHFSQPDGQLHVNFFDVGQGDAIFIQTPSGRKILIDGGYFPTILNAELGRTMPFWDREIDIVVATHPDADHVTGLVEIFERYQIGQLVTDGSEAEASSTYAALLETAENHNTSIHNAQAGEIFQIEDGVRLEIIHPGNNLETENRNDNSVSVRLVYEDFSVLLTGDAEAEAEAAMLAAQRPLTSLIFKAGHHGARTSSTPEFLAVVQPQIVVNSSGIDNKFGHPHPDVLENIADIGSVLLRTDELGSIEVMSNGREMWWQARR